MSTTHPTFEEVWQLFQETNRKFQESDRRFLETERLLKEQSMETERLLRAQSMETDLKFQETNRFLKEQSMETERLLKEQSRETDLKFQETNRFLKEQSMETDRKFRETERFLKEQSKETDRRLREVSKELGKLGNRLGDFIEEAVRPAAVRLFTQRGIAIREVQQNVAVKRDGEALEIDLLVIDDTDLVAIECKSNLGIDDVNDHLERLGKLKRLLPKYASSWVLGAVAAMVIPEQVARYAYRQGLYIISQSGEDLLIRNDAEFVPKVW